MDLSQFSPELLEYAKTHNPAPPRHFGTRYRSKGGFLPEAGNTIVCHVEKGSRTQDVMIEAREIYLATPESSQFVFTPITSLHMTLFQGVRDNQREPGFWPPELPLDAPVDDATEIMAARLEAFSMFEPFQVSGKQARPSGLLVDGRTERDRKVMHAWRDAFADLLGYRHPDHGEYPFHITFAYAIERLDDQALPRWQAMLTEVAELVSSRAPVLELTPPAFCSFEDMNHFRKRLIFDFEA